MEKYVSLRYGDMPPSNGRVEASFGFSYSDTSNAKKEGGGHRLLGRVPGSHQQVLNQMKREEGEKATLAALHRTMRAELHGKLIKGGRNVIWGC